MESKYFCVAVAARTKAPKPDSVGGMSRGLNAAAG
jgi:hypothetical protein